MKKLVITLLAAAGLTGCVAVPYGSPYYGQGYGSGAYYGPSVSVGVGPYYGYRGQRYYR